MCLTEGRSGQTCCNHAGEIGAIKDVFTQIWTEILELDPPVACVLATNPADGPRAGALQDRTPAP